MKQMFLHELISTESCLRCRCLKLKVLTLTRKVTNDLAPRPSVPRQGRLRNAVTTVILSRCFTNVFFYFINSMCFRTLGIIDQQLERKRPFSLFWSRNHYSKYILKWSVLLECSSLAWIQLYYSKSFRCSSAFQVHLIHIKVWVLLWRRINLKNFNFVLTTGLKIKIQSKISKKLWNQLSLDQQRVVWRLVE